MEAQDWGYPIYLQPSYKFPSLDEKSIIELHGIKLMHLTISSPLLSQLELSHYNNQALMRIKLTHW